MINLLLPENKKIISQEYRSRIAASASILIGLLLIIFIIGCASFYGALLINQNSLQNSLDIENLGVGVKEFDTYSSQIMRANKMISLLTSDHGNLYIASSLFDRVAAVKPAGIRLSTIGVGKSANGEWTLNLRGISSQRNDLINFVASLKKDSLFKTIDSPFTNLIKGTNGEFLITIILADLQKNV